jgi:hypothetical protein
MSKGLVAGLSLCLLALLLGGLLFIEGCHEAHWSSPAIFISVTFLGMLSPLPGVALQIEEAK